MPLAVLNELFAERRDRVQRGPFVVFPRAAAVVEVGVDLGFAFCGDGGGGAGEEEEEGGQEGGEVHGWAWRMGGWCRRGRESYCVVY